MKLPKYTLPKVRLAATFYSSKEQKLQWSVHFAAKFIVRVISLDKFITVFTLHNYHVGKINQLSALIRSALLFI